MNTFLKSVISMAAAIIAFSSCDKTLNIDSMFLEGAWHRTNADERVVEDGSVNFTFLEDGKCLVAVYNALDDSENSTHYAVRSWSLTGDMLTIDIEGGFYYRLTRKSNDKILCSSDLHSTEYYLVKEKGTDYSALIGTWSGEKAIILTDKDGVESEGVGVWMLEFLEGQKCRMTYGIKGKYGMNLVNYTCFWYPDGASFALVGDDMKAEYLGNLKNGSISMHAANRKDDSIILSKVNDQ